MMKKLSVGTNALWIMAVLLVGCGGPTPAPVPSESASAPALPAGPWLAELPVKFRALEVKDGGGCFFDDLNGATIPAGSIRVRLGAEMSMAGWIVADQQGGIAGESVGIQLLAPTSYFALAERYNRPGLGGALNNRALDAGGLRFLAGPLNVPAGKYRVLYLVQSGGELLRCDTGRELIVE